MHVNLIWRIWPKLISVFHTHTHRNDYYNLSVIFSFAESNLIKCCRILYIIHRIMSISAIPFHNFDIFGRDYAIHGCVNAAHTSSSLHSQRIWSEAAHIRTKKAE